MTRSSLCRRMLWLPVALMVMMCFAMPATAAPQQGPNDMTFYNKPSPLPAGQHGDLIRYRKAAISVPDAVAADVWQVMYLSTDGLNAPNVVTGTVLVPTADWTGTGERPVVSLGVGTQGLGQTCATSLQLQAGTCYEAANIAAGLNAGYAMVVSDYAGFTTGDIPSYMNGFSQAHAALDIIKAASQIPMGVFQDGPISPDAQVAIWGYSQGGQTAAWAGQLQSSYMPGIDLVAVAAGGVPADLLNVANYIDGNVGSSFLLQVYMGLYSQYPTEIPLYDIVNENGLAAIEDASDMCMFEALFKYMYVSTESMTKGARSLDQLMAQYPDIRDRADSMELGAIPINVPLYLYHGTADPMIPIDQALALRDSYCSRGVKTYFASFEGAEHVITMFQGAAPVMAWLQDRFNGVAVNNADVCTNRPRPVANPNDPSGDFIITMDNWHLDSMVHLGRLDQDVYQPEDSTFSADCNVTTRTVDGDIYVPTFTAPVRVLGIPLKAGFTLQPVDGMSGTLDMSNTGILTIEGSTAFSFIIDGVGLTRLQALPFTLNTREPVPMPLYFQGPVSDLGNGNITFEGETTVPRMEGGPFAPIFSAIMSGPLTYRYRVFPRDPTMY